MVLLLLFVELIDVLVVGFCSLRLLLLDLLHELADFRLERFLELLLHLCVLLKLGRCRREFDLKLLSGRLRISDVVLIFCDILFQIIKDLELLI